MYMNNLNDCISKIIRLRQSGEDSITLLAVCPNSAATLEAAVKAAAENNTPMLFAATLNQVDRDGGYTGWTPRQFVQEINSYARKYGWEGPLYPCLDHGGPWLKDHHTSVGLSLEETMREVKLSLTACIEAGYQLLHIDPTVDRSLPGGKPVPVEVVVGRTVELIAHAERERVKLGLPQIMYEVGTEEVHGGLVEFDNFKLYLHLLKAELDNHHLSYTWPAYVVAQVGTNLHTTSFDASAAEKLFEIVSPLGSLVKGHYTDWVENPASYPATGMGGANVGPEFTSEEFLALQDLCKKEQDLCKARRKMTSSDLMAILENAVLESGRWKKWLQPDELGLDFPCLSVKRRLWLTQTSARYVWTHPSVQQARQQLYEDLSVVLPDPHAYVLDRIGRAIDRYIVAFNLFDSLTLFQSIPRL
jgi:tagatose-1,6-bisphosphate aldolase non-catalytic subunit AgaZ/GatZ